jgi:hypothetical protein
MDFIWLIIGKIRFFIWICLKIGCPKIWWFKVISPIQYIYIYSMSISRVYTIFKHTWLILVGGWFQPTPLKNDGLRQMTAWHDIPNCFWKVMIQSSSKPPSRSPSYSHCWFIAYENHYKNHYGSHMSILIVVNHMTGVWCRKDFHRRDPSSRMVSTPRCASSRAMAVPTTPPPNTQTCVLGQRL